jgi:preprotein translocase subunit SecG
MTIALTMLHIAVSIFMIAVVLLQSGKGAEMGASFGSSGSQSVFGAGGGSTFLSKMTTGAAVIFMLTSLTLAYISGQPSSSSIMSSKSKPAAAVPAQQAPAAPAAPAQGTPTNLPSAPVAPAAPAQPNK